MYLGKICCTILRIVDSTINGYPIIGVQPFNGSDNQQWTFSVKTMVNKKINKCIDVMYVNVVTNKYVIANSCNPNNPNQMWTTNYI